MALGYRVFTEIERAPSDLIAQLLEYASPDLVDAMQKAGAVDGAIRPVYQPMQRFAGPAITVSLPTGSFRIKKMALEMTRPGDVLVIAGLGIVHIALLGGNIATGLMHRGLAGVIVDGAVRDSAQMKSANIPVMARGLAMNSGPVSGPGEVNVPVAFGSCVIFPGDIIVGDEEGIAVCPPAFIDQILHKAAQLKESQRRLHPTLERGEITNIADIRQQLEESGCEFISGAWT